MSFSSWLRVGSALAFAGLVAVACGDSGGGGAGGSGASSSEAGSGGSASSQGGSAAGGEATLDDCDAEPESEACKEVPWCGPFSLQEVCGPTPFPLCPASFDEWVERTPCDSVEKLEAFDTSCGGRALVRYFEGKTETWEFDADDALVSVLVEETALHECAEGGRSKVWLFGEEACEPEAGSTVDVCAGSAGSGSGGAGPGASGAPNAGGGSGDSGGVGGAL
jgi:hypothetical protein